MITHYGICKDSHYPMLIKAMCAHIMKHYTASVQKDIQLIFEPLGFELYRSPDIQTYF